MFAWWSLNDRRNRIEKSNELPRQPAFPAGYDRASRPQDSSGIIAAMIRIAAAPLPE
jgi:hypothetical protein